MPLCQNIIGIPSRTADRTSLYRISLGGAGGLNRLGSRIALLEAGCIGGHTGGCRTVGIVQTVDALMICSIKFAYIFHNYIQVSPKCSHGTVHI